MSTVNMQTPIPYWMPIDERLEPGAQPNAPELAWLKGRGDCSRLTTRKHEPSPSLLLSIWHGQTSLHGAAIAGGLLNSYAPPNRHGQTSLHGAKSVRTSGMAHGYRGRELGQDPARALASLEATPGREPNWRVFSREMGVL